MEVQIKISYKHIQFFQIDNISNLMLIRGFAVLFAFNFSTLVHFSIIRFSILLMCTIH